MKIDNFTEKISRFVGDKNYRSLCMAQLGFYNRLSDEEYLYRIFKAYTHKKLDINNPVTFNEKIQWLKINDRNPQYTMMVDKYEAKNYVSSIIGQEYIIPTLGVWDRVEDINFDGLPEQFVLKCNHNSGKGMYICTNKDGINKPKVCHELKKGLKQNYYLHGREWPYKNVKRKIIAEKYLIDESGEELKDYKFMCFNGVVDSVMVCLDRKSKNPKYYFFDKDWNLKRYNKLGKNAPIGFSLPKPPKIEEMFKIAEKLSEEIKFLRVDLYNINGKIYFGELTFYPDSGFDPNLLEETDLHFGSLLKI